jgi:hypothetical protein
MKREHPLERDVSEHIGRMPFLWVPIPDLPGPGSLRAFVERNAVALLSNLRKPVIDPPSSGWLGRMAQRDQIKASGLWNVNHVTEV